MIRAGRPDPAESQMKKLAAADWESPSKFRQVLFEHIFGFSHDALLGDSTESNRKQAEACDKRVILKKKMIKK